MLFIFWLFVLTFSVVKCSYISENYIIEAPDIDVPKSFDTAFKVYWNVPTKQCRSKKIPFDDLLKKYSITYNKNDRFEGEYITILYDGGYTPKILKSDGAKYSLKNGGLPQEGNLELHLIAFRESVNRYIPDPHFNGVGVIDMENWRPIFRQHWSSLAPVVDLSLSIEKRHYWWWPSKWQKMEATKRFEDAARLFMEKTLTTAKQMRPKAIWGYYGYPYCYNMMSNNMVEHCSKNVKDENDRLYWLWAESTALYPSIYFYSSLSTFEIKKFISGRLTEANRVKLDGTLVIPYFALTYQGKGRFLSEEEVDAVFETLQNQQASSLIVWGSSNDVNTVEKCNQLYKYVDSTFGPIAKKYIQKITKIQEQINSENEEHYFENTLNDNIYAPIVTTEIPKKILNKSQGSESTFINSIDNVLHTTKKYEVSDNETVNKSSNKNTNSSDNISSEKHLLLSNNDHRAIILPITEHTTKEKMSQNSPTNNSSNEFIILSQNVSNPVNSSVDISITEHNADYALTKNQEQQLKKYFYETDGSESDFKSNESDIWSVISYDTSSDQEETPEIIKNEKYVGNSENLIQEFIEIDNSSTVNTKDTRSILNTSKHINKTVVKENEKTSLFTLPPQNDKQNIQSFNRTIDSSIEATVTAENNDSEFKNSLKEETKLLNMSININDPKTTQKFKSNTSLESTLFLPRENSSNIETVPRESNNLTTFLEYTNWLLNSSVYSKETLVEENAKAQVSLFTITPKSDKQDDQPNKNTTNSNTDAKLNTEDKDSDYLITLAEESSKNISAFEDIEYDSDIQPLLPSEFFIKNFDYLITLEDETKTMNSTLNKNYTNTLENVKQVNTSQFTIIPPNIDSNYTTNQEDELIKNIVTPNEDATDYDGGDR